ncbi:acyltransferase [Ideonella oryzae]|uniref:Acyltransferase n=1 Tax=Ideonella oryzae TaxID=2937441 RepID=A0ABT1BQV3_9BURK|nr:acyltransferase [Ideonella oryzae]MCO5978610.1 acyltransferase [Ideonella oryzae]
MELIDHGERNLVSVAPDVPGKLRIEIKGSGNTITVGAGARFPNMRITVFASDCMIDIGAQCVLGGEIHLREANTRLRIGEKTTTMGVKITMHEAGVIDIGRDCMFAGEVRMDTSDMHSVLDAATGDRLNPPGDIHIGDHVWLGYGTYVMKGVHIGAHCVVGTGSIVTQDLPPQSLAVGIPARVIRSGVTWDRRRLPLKNPAPKT